MDLAGSQVIKSLINLKKKNITSPLRTGSEDVGAVPPLNY